jgi:hypothetical protein
LGFAAKGKQACEKSQETLPDDIARHLIHGEAGGGEKTPAFREPAGEGRVCRARIASGNRTGGTVLSSFHLFYFPEGNPSGIVS